jgi:hypothetical protein
MWLSSTKSNIGFRFVALLAFVASAEDSFAPEGFPGGNSAPIGKYSPRECSSTGWNNEPGETLNKLCGEARPASGAPRGDDGGPRFMGGCEAVLKQNAKALASLWGPHLSRVD